MFAIVVGTHGKLAEELLASAEMIYGDFKNTKAVCMLPGENTDDVVKKYQTALSELDTSGGAIFLVDLFGGGPYNAACRVVTGSSAYGIVTGVNLTMLVELISVQAVEGVTSSIHELIERAMDAAKRSVESFHMDHIR